MNVIFALIAIAAGCSSALQSGSNQGLGSCRAFLAVDRIHSRKQCLARSGAFIVSWVHAVIHNPAPVEPSGVEQGGDLVRRWVMG